MASKRALTLDDVWRRIVRYQNGLPHAVREVYRLCDAVQFEYYLIDCTPEGKEFIGRMTHLPARFASLPFFAGSPLTEIDVHDLVLTFPHQEDRLPFHLVLLEGDLRLIAQFVALDPQLVTPESFRLAIAAGHLVVAQTLLHMNPSVVEVTSFADLDAANEDTAVCVAAANGRLEILQWLHASGHELVWHALVTAAINGHEDVVTYLLGHELSSGSPDHAPVHWTPSHPIQSALACALCNGHAGVVLRLLQYGPCTLQEHPDMPFFKWSVASVVGRHHVQALQHLLDASIDVSSLDATAVHEIFSCVDFEPTIVLDATDAEIEAVVRALPRAFYVEMLLAAARDGTLGALTSVFRGILQANITLDLAADIEQALASGATAHCIKTHKAMRSFLHRVGLDDTALASVLMEARRFGTLPAVQWLDINLVVVCSAAAMAEAARADDADIAQRSHDTFELDGKAAPLLSPAAFCRFDVSCLLDRGDITSLEKLVRSLWQPMHMSIDWDAAKTQAAQYGQRRLLQWINKYF